MSCVHAILAMGWNNLRPKECVHEYLRLDKWRKAYEPLIQSLNGSNMWPTIRYDSIQSPPIYKLASKPKTQRNKDIVKAKLKMLNPTKARRRLIPICSKCKQ